VSYKIRIVGHKVAIVKNKVQTARYNLTILIFFLAFVLSQF